MTHGLALAGRSLALWEGLLSAASLVLCYAGRKHLCPCPPYSPLSSLLCLLPVSAPHSAQGSAHLHPSSAVLVQGGGQQGAVQAAVGPREEGSPHRVLKDSWVCQLEKYRMAGQGHGPAMEA